MLTACADEFQVLEQYSDTEEVLPLAHRRPRVQRTLTPAGSSTILTISVACALCCALLLALRVAPGLSSAGMAAADAERTSVSLAGTASALPLALGAPLESQELAEVKTGSMKAVGRDRLVSIDRDSQLLASYGDNGTANLTGDFVDSLESLA